MQAQVRTPGLLRGQTVATSPDSGQAPAMQTAAMTLSARAHSRAGAPSSTEWRRAPRESGPASAEPPSRGARGPANIATELMPT